MTPVHADMLKKFGQFSRDRNYFTTTGYGFMGLAPTVAQRNLDELEQQGLIAKIKTGYKLTSKGRCLMDGPGETKAPPTRRPDYIPKKWEPARGAEAEQHQQYKSLPVAPQIQKVAR